VEEHLPPEAIAYRMQDPQWCLKQAEVVGPNAIGSSGICLPTGCWTICARPRGSSDWAKSMGPLGWRAPVLERCFFDNPRYRTVKGILEKGLDQMPFVEELNRAALASTYTSAARFMRRPLSWRSIEQGGPR